MRRRLWLWATVPIVLICALGVYIAILPMEYDCSGFAVRGGRVEMDPRALLARSLIFAAPATCR